MSSRETRFDVIVVGSGLVGLTCALALSRQGLDVAICSPASMRKDTRTTALLMDSIRYLEKLDLWQYLAGSAYPLKTMRIVDGSNRLLRAPQTDFRASEIGLECFGYNVQNQAFADILEQHVVAEERITRVEGMARGISVSGNDMHVDVEADGDIAKYTAGFVVGADGGNSIVRRELGINTRQWEYPQSAIVFDFSHEHSSRGTSTEFHTETGPFTIVPRSEHMAGLVWLERPDQAEKTVAMEQTALENLLERKMQSFLGKITLQSPPRAFPMRGLVANRLGDGNWALVGEAAHVFPPIGAQGFNLAMRDISALETVLGRFTTQENRGAQYAKAREADVNLRTRAVDTLNRSLISSFLPVHLVRGMGFHLLSGFPALRKTVMRFGISPGFRARR